MTKLLSFCRWFELGVMLFVGQRSRYGGAFRTKLQLDRELNSTVDDVPRVICHGKCYSTELFLYAV